MYIIKGISFYSKHLESKTKLKIFYVKLMLKLCGFQSWLSRLCKKCELTSTSVQETTFKTVKPMAQWDIYYFQRYLTMISNITQLKTSKGTVKNTNHILYLSLFLFSLSLPLSLIFKTRCSIAIHVFRKIDREIER